MLGYDPKEMEKIISPYVEFSPYMSDYEKTATIDAFYLLLKQKIKTEPGSYFEKVFGGTGTSDVIHYLQERVNYIVSDETLDVSGFSDHPLKESSETVSAWDNFVDTMMNPGPKYRMRNLGINLWFKNIADRKPNRKFRLGNKKIPIRSPRVGILSITNRYVHENGIYRIAALIHDARHSDCTGGISRSQIWSGHYPKACGHLHVACPWSQESDASSVVYCDNHPWGSHGITIVYLNAVINDCQNCPVNMKYQAKQLRDYWLKFILLKKDFLSGAYGDPDMTSQGLQY